MGSLASKEPAISNLNFAENIRAGQVLNASRVLKIDNRNFIVELADGRLITTGDAGWLHRKCLYLDFGASGTGKMVIHGLVKLGLVSRDAAKRHIENAAKRQAEHDRKQKVRYLKELCADLGVDLPAMVKEEATK